MMRINAPKNACVKYVMEEMGWSRLEATYECELFMARYTLDYMKDSITKPNYKFGDRVIYTHVIKRSGIGAISNELAVCKPSNELDVCKPCYLFWSPEPLPSKENGVGLFIGYRTLQARFLYDNRSIDVDRYIKVAKVVKNGRSNPITVAVQGMTKLESI
jgi:hypothetical protein